MQYLNEIKTKDINQKLIYKIKLEVEQNFLASLFIKIVNESENEKDEKYYAIPINFNTYKTFIEKNEISIIIIFFVISIIIILLISFLCWRKIKRKSIALEKKIKANPFTGTIDEDFIDFGLANKSGNNNDNEKDFI